jgi:hypothetical protein
VFVQDRWQVDMVQSLLLIDSEAVNNGTDVMVQEYLSAVHTSKGISIKMIMVELL